MQRRPRSFVNHGIFTVPWFTFLISVVMTVLYLFPDQCFGVLLFDKTAIISGEYWRFLTGHFAHCRFEHFFWDVLAFAILGAVIELNAWRDFIPSLIVSCLGVSLWLFLCEGASETYCGLSGALNGLAVVAAVVMWRQAKSRTYLIVILALMGKIIFELITHQTIFTDLSAQSVPAAHLVGFISGGIYVGWGGLLEFFRRNETGALKFLRSYR